MHSSTYNSKKILQSVYKLHGHILKTEEASRYLGVTINDNLTWNKPILNITNKGNTTLGFSPSESGYLYSYDAIITGVRIKSLGYIVPGPHQTA